MHCFGQLEASLRVNFVTVIGNDTSRQVEAEYKPRICAIDEEHGVFKTAKLHTGYKVRVWLWSEEGWFIWVEVYSCWDVESWTSSEQILK